MNGTHALPNEESAIKIYTAATFQEQERIRHNKETLIKLGHSVLSTWLEEQIKPVGMTDEEFGRKMAMKDLQEITASDCLILDLENPSKTMGKMVEFGFALAKHKLVYVVAPGDTLTKGHIFCLLADKVFASWDELFEYFRKAHEGTPVSAEEFADYLRSRRAQV
jgi:nucleoside 2-deoxyribosyltransferase